MALWCTSRAVWLRRTELIQQWIRPVGVQSPWLSAVTTPSDTAVPDDYESASVWVSQVSAKHHCVTVSILVISSDVRRLRLPTAGIQAAAADCRTVCWLHATSVNTKTSHSSVRSVPSIHRSNFS